MGALSGFFWQKPGSSILSRVMTTDEVRPLTRKAKRVLWAFVVALLLGVGWFQLIHDEKVKDPGRVPG